MTQDDLERPGAANRGRAVARPGLMRAICRFPSGEQRPTYARDLSVFGAFLMSLRPPGLGTLLAVVLCPENGPAVGPIDARVIGARLYPSDAESSGSEVVFTRIEDGVLDGLCDLASLYAGAARQPAAPVESVGEPMRGQRRGNVLEEREQPRVRASVRVVLGGAGRPAELRAINLSLSGALLTFPATRVPDVSPGKTVELAVVDPHAPESIPLRAQVVRWTASHEPMGFAVRFVDVDWVTAARLEGLLLDAAAAGAESDGADRARGREAELPEE